MSEEKKLPICEICEKNKGDMVFNCYMPSFGAMVQGFVCMPCYGEAESDMHIAVDIVGKRMTKAGVQKGKVETSVFLQHFKLPEKK